MKKIICGIFLILIIAISIKYFTSDYEINYKLDKYDIKIIYKDSRYYVEIKSDKVYNFDIYKQRSINKLKVLSIKEIDGSNYKCIIPNIKNVKTHPLCYIDNEYVNYNFIDDENMDKYKIKNNTFYSDKEFYYNQKLTNKEYTYLWNYKGFYKMNGKNMENISFLSNDHYDSSLVTVVNDKIVLPNYDERHIFKSIYVIDIETSKIKIIESKYEIDYNSYIVGNIKNKLYLYDIKNSILYEIDLKKMEIKLICDEELGYFKYDNGKKVNVKKSEYKNQKVRYNNTYLSNYKYAVDNNVIYKSYNELLNNKEKIYKGEDIRIINEYKNSLYFISKDIMYKYNGINTFEIFKYFELNFNKSTSIIIYNK